VDGFASELPVESVPAVTAGADTVTLYRLVLCHGSDREVTHGCSANAPSPSKKWQHMSRNAFGQLDGEQAAARGPRRGKEHRVAAGCVGARVSRSAAVGRTARRTSVGRSIATARSDDATVRAEVAAIGLGVERTRRESAATGACADVGSAPVREQRPVGPSLQPAERP